MIDPATLITIPAGECLLGIDPGSVDSGIRARDRELNLGLAAVLSATPPRRVEVGEFQIMPRMTTHGEYREFWNSAHPSHADRLLVDDIEVWDFVWQQHGIEHVRVAGNEPGTSLIESYAGCGNALDALLRARAYECQRLLLNSHVPPGDGGWDDTSTTIVSVFSWLRAAVADVIGGDAGLSPAERSAAGDGPLRAAKLSALIQERLRGDAAAGLQLLLRRALAASPLRPSRLLHPQEWPDDPSAALKKPGIFGNSSISLEEQPVTGVSLYEAFAFAAWLGIGTGLPFTLPNEAEWEKAFSWDAASGTKHVYPWQGRVDRDFNEWFSRDGHRVADLRKRPAAWRALIEETARDIGGKKLYQGLGFGWQWTRERFDELERKYNRFDRSDWPRSTRGGRIVHGYRDTTDRSFRFATVRGAPDQLGGPGTTTRRFALSPLRGNPDCGFRCVVSEASIQ